MRKPWENPGPTTVEPRRWRHALLRCKITGPRSASGLDCFCAPPALSYRCYCRMSSKICHTSGMEKEEIQYLHISYLPEAGWVLLIMSKLLNSPSPQMRKAFSGGLIRLRGNLDLRSQLACI